MNWKPELDDLARREAFAREMGGVDKVKRQRDQGRLTVRERIDQYDVIVGVVDELAGADVVFEFFGRSARPGGKDDDVRPVGIHFAEGPVSDPRVAERFAAN